MSTPQKLYTTAIKTLQRKLRPHSLLLHELLLHPPRSRVSSHHSQLFIKPRVSGESQRSDHLFQFSQCLRSFFSTETNHGAEFTCWNCNELSPAARPFLHCGSCKAVQPVDFSVDYFQIFGLEQGYDLKDENLDGKYKEWQKKLHPDLVHSKSEKEKSYAAEQSARVIDAFHILSKPLSRALYLLQLAGIVVDEEKTVMDPELLSEMLDLREAVEEADDPKALMSIQSQTNDKSYHIKCARLITRESVSRI